MSVGMLKEANPVIINEVVTMKDISLVIIISENSKCNGCD